MLVVTGSIGFGPRLPAAVPMCFFWHGASVSENWSRRIAVSWFSSAFTTRICFLMAFPKNAGLQSMAGTIPKPKLNSTQNLLLVGGFNPIEKYQSIWIISPGRGENKKSLKPPPSLCFVSFCCSSLHHSSPCHRWDSIGWTVTKLGDIDGTQNLHVDIHCASK